MSHHMKYFNNLKIKCIRASRLSFAPLNVILHTCGHFNGQLQIALESYAHRLAMEQFFVGS